MSQAIEGFYVRKSIRQGVVTSAIVSKVYTECSSSLPRNRGVTPIDEHVNFFIEFIFQNSLTRPEVCRTSLVITFECWRS